MNKTNNFGKKVFLETSKGEIIIQLYGDMPITSGNFEKLVNKIILISIYYFLTKRRRGGIIRMK